MVFLSVGAEKVEDWIGWFLSAAGRGQVPVAYSVLPRCTTLVHLQVSDPM